MKKGKALRLLSNRGWLAGRSAGGRSVEPVEIGTGRSKWRDSLSALAVWRYDAALIDCNSRLTLVVCLGKKLFPFARCRLVSVDIILTKPKGGLPSQTGFALRRWLLREVDRFVLYFRDSADLQRVYSIPDERVRYVPFKVNTSDRLKTLQTADEQFFLACGRSNRDYATLFEAVRGLDCRIKILAPWKELEMHGTVVPGVERPPNVELVSDDGSADSWNAWIARSTAVVLPIEPGMLSPSGIGTYLVAMALAKCVIITEGPATRRILDESNAVLVQPRDASSLRRAIQRVSKDTEFRNRIARAGQAYALSLGGEERLRGDLMREIADIVR